MTNTDEARRLVRETIEKLGGVDLIIANAVSPFLSFLFLLLAEFEHMLIRRLK